jgi:predicted dehydrogenase
LGRECLGSGSIAGGHGDQPVAELSGRFSANAEFGYVDNTPDPVTSGWRRVIVGPDHPYIAAAQSMPFSGIGHGGQEFFTYQARAFLDEIAGLDRLPRQATFADGLRNMRVEEAIVKSAATGAAVTVPR